MKRGPACLMAAFLAVSGVGALGYTDGTWSGTASGNWWDGTKWSGGNIADGTNATATFYVNINAGYTITIDAAGRTIGNLTVNDQDTGNPNAWSFAGGTLTLDRSDSVIPRIWLRPSKQGSGSTHTFSCLLAGNKGLWVHGIGGVLLTTVPAYTGETHLHGGTLTIRANQLSATSIAYVNKGGALQAHWNGVSESDNRIDNALPIRLRGGKLAVWADSGGTWCTCAETACNVYLDYGHVTFSAGGKRSVASLTVTNLVRQKGSSAYFHREGNSSGASNGSYGYGRVYLTGQAEGFLCGWGLARRYEYVSGVLQDSGFDFPYYETDHSDTKLRGVIPLALAEPTVARPGQVEGAAAGDHVKAVASQNTLTADRTIASLLVTGGYSHDLGGRKLDIASGGLLCVGGGDYLMSNGSLTSGGGEICLLNAKSSGSLTIGADLSGSGVDVITRGSMALSGNNTFSGDLYVNEGAVTLGGANIGLHAAQVAPGATVSLGAVDALPAAATVHLLFDGEEYGKATNSVGTVKVYALTLAGVDQPEGTYGSTSSSATYKNDDYFSGTGMLEVNKTLPAMPPTVLNEIATNISATAACFNGHLFDAGTTPTTVKLFWGMSNGGMAFGAWDQTNVWTADYWADGSHPTAPVTFPTPDRMYYYTFYATNSGGEAWALNGVQTLLGGEVSIAAGDQASEVGPVDGSFTISRPAGAGNGALTVSYGMDETVANTASNGIDYSALSGSVVLPEGVASTTLAVRVVVDYGDSTAEPEETVKINLLPGAYAIASPGTAQITIANDPTPPDTLYLQTDQNVDSGGTIAGNTAADGSGVALAKARTSGDGTTANPFLYRFDTGTDFQGHLDLRNRKIYSAQPRAFTLDMGGHSITGFSGVTAMSTHSAVQGGVKADINLINVASVAVGTITTEKYDFAVPDPGDIRIGTIGSRAGTVRMDGLVSCASKNQGTPIGNSGDVAIYGSQDVRIATSGGAAGNIETWAGTAAAHAGAVTVNHDGAFTALTLATYALCSGYSAGSITLNGDGLGDGASGSCSLSNLLTHATDAVPGQVTIGGYNTVHIAGRINAENLGATSTASGNIIIANIADSIRIDGAITANVASGNAYDGYLKMECGGGITVSNLNLSLVSYASFDAGAESYIMGALTGADGAAATSATVGNLRAATGTRIRYLPALNAGMNGETVDLNKPDGSSGGGILSPLASNGTMIIVR